MAELLPNMHHILIWIPSASERNKEVVKSKVLGSGVILALFIPVFFLFAMED